MSKRVGKVTIRKAQEALTTLFPTCRFTVAPNGLPSLWVKDEHGYGMYVSFSSGKAGVSATIGKFAGSPPITITGNKSATADPIQQTDAMEVTCTVYRDDMYSRQFKRWYGADAIGRKDVKHPDELAMVPTYKVGEPNA